MEALKAAVLVPLHAEPPAGLQLTFIQRSASSNHHPSQVAFPGGRFDPGRDESLLATALREAEEEIGLPAAEVSVLGALPERRTLSSGYRITPFVGRIPTGFAFRPDPREVEAVFSVPLNVFAAEQERQILHWPFQGTMYAVPCIRFAGRIVWGVTLDIIDDLLGSDLLPS